MKIGRSLLCAGELSARSRLSYHIVSDNFSSTSFRYMQRCSKRDSSEEIRKSPIKPRRHKIWTLILWILGRSFHVEGPIGMHNHDVEPCQTCSGNKEIKSILRKL